MARIKKEIIGMLVKSVRNGVLAEVISENEKTVQLKMKDSGEIKDFIITTFKRWWKEVDGDGSAALAQATNLASEAANTATEAHETLSEAHGTLTEAVSAIEDAAKIVSEVAAESGAEQAPEEPDEEAGDGQPDGQEEKPKKKGRTKIAGDHTLKGVLESLAISRGCDIFEGKVKSFRSLKVDGAMCMAFTFNTKGISLWLRSAAVEGITEFKHMNHMFDARVNLTKDNEESHALLEKMLDASIKHQREKKASTLKAQKGQRKAEKAASKAAGAEAE